MADLLVNTGLNFITDLIDGTEANPTWYIGWGTGAGTTAPGDTTLFTEASETRVVAAMSQPTAPVNQFLGTLTADGSKTITNCGTFDAVTNGTLFTKSDFTGIPLALGDKIQFTFQLTHTAV